MPASAPVHCKRHARPAAEFIGAIGHRDAEKSMSGFWSTRAANGFSNVALCSRRLRVLTCQTDAIHALRTPAKASDDPSHSEMYHTHDRKSPTAGFAGV